LCYGSHVLSLPSEPADLELLRQLLNKSKHTPLKAQTAAAIAKKNSRPDLIAALDAMAAAGLVVRTATAKSVSYQATEATGLEVAALAPPPTTKAARKPAAKDLGAELLALEGRLLGALLPRLEQIERALGIAKTASAPATGKPAITDDELIALVHAVGANEDHGMLVPIGAVRAKAIEERAIDREAFDRRLLALERAFRLDLKVADDPRRPDAADGIEVPGRGLVFFAVDRAR